MPRRISDYADAFAGWNMVPSLGAFLSFAATQWFVFVVFHTFIGSKQAAANPWGQGATTLEWAVPSPPPFHTYEEVPQIQ